jgi:hypothetical protein
MIGTTVYDLLRYDTTVYNLVGTRIYPGYADNKAVYPYIVYDVISVVGETAKGTTSLIDRYRVQVTVIDDSYADLMTLADAARTALEGFSGTATAGAYYITSTLFDGMVDTVEDEQVYGRALDFIFRVRKITG